MRLSDQERRRLKRELIDADERMRDRRKPDPASVVGSSLPDRGQVDADGNVFTGLGTKKLGLGSVQTSYDTTNRDRLESNLAANSVDATALKTVGPTDMLPVVTSAIRDQALDSARLYKDAMAPPFLGGRRLCTSDTMWCKAVLRQVVIS